MTTKIAFFIGVKLVEIKEGLEVTHKEYLAIKVNNLFDTITIKKALSDTVYIPKILCLKASKSSIQVEYMKNLFSILPEELEVNIDTNLMKENYENLIEARCFINNKKC